MGICFFNLEIHNLNTRYNYSLHLPSTNITMVQKGVLHSGSKLFNNLPLEIKSLSGDVKHFKIKLKSFLIEVTGNKLCCFCWEVQKIKFKCMYKLSATTITLYNIHT